VFCNNEAGIFSDYAFKIWEAKREKNIVPTALKLQIQYLYTTNIPSRWDFNAGGMICV
jgi:hypothetical protein